MVGFEKVLGAVKVIKDQIQYRSRSLLNLARGYFIISKYIYQLSEKTLFLSVFDFLGFRDFIFKKLDLLCLFEFCGLLFIKFGKSLNKRESE